MIIKKCECPKCIDKLDKCICWKCNSFNDNVNCSCKYISDKNGVVNCEYHNYSIGKRINKECLCLIVKDKDIQNRECCKKHQVYYYSKKVA